MTAVQLSAGAGSELNWDAAKKLARTHISQRKRICWEIDLGLEIGTLFLKDSALFFSCGLALEQFSKEIWPEFKDETLAVSLFRGPFEIAERIFWDASLDEDFQDYMLHLEDASQRKLFFAATMFAEFLHRLISYLPTEVVPLCQFKIPEGMGRALAACLFSRARFEYLHLQMPVPVQTISTAVVIPSDAFCTQAALTELEEIFKHLEKNRISFRMISEIFLTEEWNGIEQLYVSKAVSPQGKRMLQGFVAAGGTILECGNLLPLFLQRDLSRCYIEATKFDRL